MERLLKVPEVAQVLAMSRAATYQLVQRGDIRSVKMGRARRVPAGEVELYVRQLLAEGDRPTTRPRRAAGA